MPQTFINSELWASFTQAEQDAVNRLSRQLGRVVYLEDTKEILGYATKIKEIESRLARDEAAVEEAIHDLGGDLDIIDVPSTPGIGIHGSLRLDTVQAGVPGRILISVPSNNANDLMFFGGTDAGSMVLFKSVVPDNSDNVKEVYIDIDDQGFSVTPEEGCTWGRIVEAINDWSVQSLSVRAPIASLSDPETANIVYMGFGCSIQLVR